MLDSTNYRDPWSVNDTRDVRPLGPAFCYVPELTDDRLLADPYAPLRESIRAPHRVRRFRPLRRFTLDGRSRDRTR